MGIGPDQRIFPISCTAGREVLNKAGKIVGIHLKPHDLRRHAANHPNKKGGAWEPSNRKYLAMF
jgi:hypothetical protein